jgi:hypothetical protein
MYKVTIKSIRPDTTKEFFRYDDDMYDYIDEAYLQTNKLLGKKVSITKDRTTETIELMFENKQAWLEYMKDPIIVYQEPIKVRYNGYNKVAVSINVEEITVTKDLYNVYLR